MLSIIKTLKEFRNIHLGQQIKVYINHQNLTYVNFDTERIMRWRLIIEEYSPELIYLKGQTNIVAHALSRLNIDTSKQISNIRTCDLLHRAFHADLSDNIFPLQYKLIAQHQTKHKDLLS